MYMIVIAERVQIRVQFWVRYKVVSH